MLPAASISDINDHFKSSRYSGEKRIVGIMLARYTIAESRDMVKQHFDYWNYFSEERYHIFWLGYGAYALPGEPGQIMVEGVSCMPRVFFDNKIFIEGVNEITKSANIKYKDSIGILLCNFYANSLHLGESVYIEIETLIKEHGKEFRKYMNDLIADCKKHNDISEIKLKYKIKPHMIELKKKAKPLDIIGKIAKK